MSINEIGQVPYQSDTLYENEFGNKLQSITIFTPLSKENNHLDNFQHSSKNEDSNENH